MYARKMRLACNRLEPAWLFRVKFDASFGLKIKQSVRGRHWPNYDQFTSSLGQKGEIRPYITLYIHFYSCEVRAWLVTEDRQIHNINKTSTTLNYSKIFMLMSLKNSAEKIYYFCEF